MKKMLFGLVAALMVTGFASQAYEYDSGYKSLSAGDSDAGFTGCAYAYCYANNDYAKAYAYVDGDVKFLGRTFNAVYGRAECYDTYGDNYAKLRVDVVGYTVYSQSYSYVYSKSWKASRTLASASMTVWCGPVPVTLSGSVGGACGLSVSFDPVPPYLYLSGGPYAYATGSASAGVGIPGYNVGVKTDLRILDSALTGTVYLNIYGSASGSLRATCDPLKIYLKAYAQAWPFYWDTTLTSWSTSGWSYTLLSL